MKNKDLNSIKHLIIRIKMKGYLKRIHDSLNFYATNTKEKINNNIKKENEPFFRSNVPEQVEKILYANKYISDNEKECLDPLYMVTPKGDIFLRELDKVYYRDWKFYVVLGTAIATLGRLFGWW